MRILTWNINSVRLRFPIILDIINEFKPDIICLQETKTVVEFFPLSSFQEAGYEYAHIAGMKSYNGVAILSRIPLKGGATHARVSQDDCRHVSVSFFSEKLKSDVDLHNLYIPAGGDEPDVTINDKFAHKLNFVDEISAWFKKSYKTSDHVIVVGDFNIAPLEHDVWSSKQLRNVVSHTAIEIEKLNAMQKSLSWVDAMRNFVPSDEKLYTWWSYRNKDWRKSNRGRRLDHIWVTNPLAPSLQALKIADHARDFEKPSDHVPVMIDIDL
jgi:exodeoxyribonuclease-3